MNTLVKVRLDGNPIDAPAGSTILEVARREGVYIPTLCYSPLLPPLENCRLCVVAVTGERQYKSACSTLVRDGMEITTHSPELQQTRKFLLELLLDTHYGDCVAPCTVTCPANVDIQGYLALIRSGDYLEAVQLIKQKIPMPASIGRVCPHPCEGACRRHLVDKPVNINHCKRFVADYEMRSGRRILPRVPAETGRKVAIIGGGPAGLSAAYYLRSFGHGATIFESRSKLGGMLRYGIPEYRLPKTILDWEIEGILSLGVSVKTGVRWGQDFTLDDLKKDNFDAIFLAIGAWQSRNLGIVGEDLDGVVSGVAFLERVGSGQPVAVGRKVVIIGGGNVAIDAARTTLRLGADRVTVLYRRSRKEMPASPEEIEAAEAEGVDIQLLAAPIRALGDNGAIRQLELIRMELGEPDAGGRRRPVPVEGSETIIETDQLISAIGQFPEIIPPARDGAMRNIPSTRWNTIGGDPRSMYTGHERVFVGGDLFQGPMTVVAALADGRKAAYSLDRSFAVGTVQPEPLHFNISKGTLDAIDREAFEAMKTSTRERMPELDTAQRVRDFTEVELGLSEAQAKREAERCLVCGCAAAFECKLREYMNEFQVDWRVQPSKKIHFQRVAVMDTHPNIALDPNKCVRCERCVTACRLFQCSDAIDFKDWPKFNERCVSCGLCVDLCPTGALMEKRQGRPVDRLDWNTVATHCRHCGLGCRLDLKLKGERLVWIADGQAEPPGNASTCSRGRFHAYDLHWYGARITKPMIRQGGSLQEASWGKAIEVLIQEFRAAAELGGADAVAALASPEASNEGLYLLQKWLRLGWKSNGLDFPGRDSAEECLAALAAATGQVRLDAPLSRLVEAPAVFAWGDVSGVVPVVGTQLRRAVRGGRLKLVQVSGAATELSPFTATALTAGPGVWGRIAGALGDALVDSGAVAPAVLDRITELTEPSQGLVTFNVGEHGFTMEAFKRLLQAVVEAPAMAFTVPANAVAGLDPDERRGFWRALVKLALLKCDPTGGALPLLHPCFADGNSVGALLMGVSPTRLPGFLPLADAAARQAFMTLNDGLEPPAPFAGEPAAALEAGRVKAVLAQEPSRIWEQGLISWQNRLQQVPFLTVMDCVESPALETAQVVLPLAAFGEQSGTVINQEGRWLQLAQAMPPEQSSLADWEILGQILAAQGLPFPRGLETVREEIGKLGLAPEKL